MYRLKQIFWFLFTSERCEFCKGKLRRHGDRYYGGVDIKDTLGNPARRTAYLCNLCYLLFKGVET